MIVVYIDPEFNLQKLNDVEVKRTVSSENLKTGLRRWKPGMVMWTSVRLGRVLERISQFQPKRF